MPSLLRWVSISSQLLSKYFFPNNFPPTKTLSHQHRQDNTLPVTSLALICHLRLQENWCEARDVSIELEELFWHCWTWKDSGSLKSPVSHHPQTQISSCCVVPGTGTVEPSSLSDIQVSHWECRMDHLVGISLHLDNSLGLHWRGLCFGLQTGGWKKVFLLACWKVPKINVSKLKACLKL